jgi:hypothetical protein
MKTFVIGLAAGIVWTGLFAFHFLALLSIAFYLAAITAVARTQGRSASYHTEDGST